MINYFIETDTAKLNSYKWDDINRKPLGVVHIFHGMAEHVFRYDDFAKYLNCKGFIVYGHDHRGHGATVSDNGSPGFFDHDRGWDKVVEDCHYVTEHIKGEHEDLPIFVFAHSMGSFIARDYITRYGKELDGVILSGTGDVDNFSIKGGLTLAKLQRAVVGDKHASKLLDKLSFGSFNNAFKPTRTEFDWLSRDQEQVDKYINDDLCGGVFTAAFFSDFLYGIKGIKSEKKLKLIPKDLSLFVIAGDKDPVGHNGEDILRLVETYRQLDIADVAYKLYKDHRHEIVNEIDHDVVYEDVSNWLIRKCETRVSSEF